MKRSSLLFLWLLIATSFSLRVAYGQHCPPIIESYCESISLKHTNGQMILTVDYRKSGGQRKSSYQAYILAYPQSNAEKIARISPQAAIESKLAVPIHTQLTSQQENNCYRIQWETDDQDFVKSMLKKSLLNKDRIEDVGGYMNFADEIRLAIFIPFLEDKAYSVVEGLPENRHECNYGQRSCLLFDTLPQVISVHFGIVQGFAIPHGKYHVQLNGNRVAQRAEENAK